MNPRSYHHRISTRSSQGAIRCRATTTTTSRAQTIIKSHEFIDNDKLKQIGDAATQASAQRMVRMPVALRIPNLPASISTAVVPPSAVQDTTQAAKSPIVMLHSFDSSCLEYRRLHPRLDQHHPSYAVDLIGWGFTVRKIFAYVCHHLDLTCDHVYVSVCRIIHSWLEPEIIFPPSVQKQRGST